MEQQKKVKTIPATLTRFTSTPISERKKRRVAGYARVYTDEELQTFFISAVNKLLAGKADAIAEFSEIVDTVLDTSDLERERSEYQKKYDDLSRRFDDAKAKLELVKAQIADKTARRATIEDFLSELRSLDGPVTEFDPVLFSRLVDFYTAYGKDDVRVTFKNGTEIKA